MDILTRMIENDALKAKIATDLGISVETLAGTLVDIQKIMRRHDTEAEMRAQIERAAKSGKSLLSIKDLLDIWAQQAHESDITTKIGDPVKAISEVQDYFLREASTVGLSLGPQWSELNTALNGLRTDGLLYVIGGRGSSAKTTYLRNLALNLIQQNPNKVFVVYASLDDSVVEMMPHFISQLSGLKPDLVGRYGTLPQAQRQLVETAFQKMRDIQDHLLLLDSSNMNTLTDLLRLNNFICNKYHDRKVVFIIDNFHDIQYVGENREKYMAIAIKLKESAVEHNNAIFASVQLVKLRGRPGQPIPKPTREDMSETVEIDYKSNLVMLAHNDYDANRAAPEFREVIVDGNGRQILKPVIEIMVEKNKVVPTCKGSYYFKFDGDSSRLIQIERSCIEAYRYRTQTRTATTAAPASANRRATATTAWEA